MPHRVAEIQAVPDNKSKSEAPQPEVIFRIKDILGHRDINITNKYVDINIDMKREAIDKTAPDIPSNLPDGEADLPQRHKEPVFNFLKQLSQQAALC